MVPRARKPLAFALLFGVVLAYESWAFFARPLGVPAAAQGRRWLAGEIAGPVVVGQTFVVDAAGLDGVTIHARARHDRIEGHAVFALFQYTPAPQLLFDVKVPVRDVVASSSYTVRFRPVAVEPSPYRTFRLDVSVPDARAGWGIGLAASREQTYRAGALYIDGEEQWADLVFETTAAHATIAASVRDALRRVVGSREGAGWYLALAFGAYNAVLGAVLWWVVLDQFGEAPLMTLEHQQAGRE